MFKTEMSMRYENPFLGIVLATPALSGCQSFQKERDLELYLFGASLSYAAAKHICRTSDFNERCAGGAAAAFVLWC